MEPLTVPPVNQGTTSLNRSRATVLLPVQEPTLSKTKLIWSVSQPAPAIK